MRVRREMEELLTPKTWEQLWYMGKLESWMRDFCRGKEGGKILGKVLGYLRWATKSRTRSKSEGRGAPSEVREHYERNKAGQAMQSGCHVPKVWVCCEEGTGERCCQLASLTDLQPTEGWTLGWELPTHTSNLTICPLQARRAGDRG